MGFADGSDETGWWHEWGLPDDTRPGDVGVMFAGGRRRCYLGIETIASRWKKYRSGPLKGESYVDCNWTMFKVPVPAAAVDEALGLPAPTDATRLDDHVGDELVAFLRRYQRPLGDPVEAIEGIMTESRRRSRSRNTKLRAAKLAASRGVCEACGVRYRNVSGIAGTRVLTVHHRHQLSAYDTPRTTSIDHLAVLCANCHMLVHADPHKALPVEELARRLGKVRWVR